MNTLEEKQILTELAWNRKDIIMDSIIDANYDIIMIITVNFLLDIVMDISNIVLEINNEY